MIYLDHAAATPVCKQALEAMLPYFSDNFFNPSSPYLPAQQLKDEYKAAKDRLAHTIGAKGTDLIITSGATESNALALSKHHVLALCTEHPSVLAYASDTIAVDHTGRINLADLKAKLAQNPETTIVSVALAGGELGTIQPLAEIAEIIREERQTRLAQGNRTPLLLHSDASQALPLLDFNVSRLGVDLMTLNSPKVYGPKGVGALYIAHHVKLTPLIKGGGQERGLRSGTENVPALIGFATAAEFAKKHLGSHRKQYENLVKILRSELEKSPVKPIFLGNKKHHLTNFCPVSFPGIDAERLIYRLEEDGVYVSTGAACAASKGEKSKTLEAIGLSDAEIAGSLRLSLGTTNLNPENPKAAEAEIRRAGQLIVAAVKKELENVNQ